MAVNLNSIGIASIRKVTLCPHWYYQSWPTWAGRWGTCCSSHPDRTCRSDLNNVSCNVSLQFLSLSLSLSDRSSLNYQFLFSPSLLPLLIHQLFNPTCDVEDAAKLHAGSLDERAGQGPRCHALHDRAGLEVLQNNYLGCEFVPKLRGSALIKSMLYWLLIFNTCTKR